MKNIIKASALAVLLGAGLMSCSVVEGVLGGSEGESNSFGGMVDALWGLLKGFLPSLAAWEGCGSIFSTRKRKHYTRMVMAIVPSDKNMDFGSAAGSLGAALGISHSTSNSKIAFEDDELEEISEKMES